MSINWLHKRAVNTRQFEERLTQLDLLLIHEQFLIDWMKSKNKINPHDEMRHICTNECDMFTTPIAENVYVCRSSNRIHYCTSASCDSIIFEQENRACSITGMAYDLESFIDTNTLKQIERGETVKVFVDKITVVNHSEKKLAKLALIEEANMMLLLTNMLQPPLLLTEGKECTEIACLQESRMILIGAQPTQLIVQPQKKIVRPKHPKRMVSTELTLMRVTGLNRRKIPKKRMNKEKLLCTAIHFIGKLLPSLIISESHRIASTIVYLWVKILETDYYCSVKGRYRFGTHIAVVLYNALDGIRGAGGCFILKPELELYKMLPASKQLKHYGIKPSTYTKCCRYLHEITREWIV